jgi:aspartokinase-like uncharacterized kinase
MIVVKVGGSLFDHPALGPGLRAYLETLGAEVLLVPGGGLVADAVRELDRVHGLGEEAAHWLALRSLGVTGALLERLLGLTSPLEGEVAGADFGSGGWGVSTFAVQEVADPRKRAAQKQRVSPHPPPASLAASEATSPSRGEVKDKTRVLDCFAFACEDELRPGALPHTWSVTTDSIAARAAVVFRAERLVLLKSTDIPPGTSWESAAANGWVDAHFPQIAPTIACPIEVVNFRRHLSPRA